MSATFVRDAKVDDLACILAIERATAEAPHWSEEAWRDAVVGPSWRRVVWVAERDSEVCGFIVLSRTMDLAELESMAVEQRIRRQGVARLLLLCAQQWARAQKLGAIELEVRAANEGAQALYRATGFEEQGRRKEYYRDPDEDAVLMAWAMKVS